MTITEQEQGHFQGSFINGRLEFGYRMNNVEMLAALDLLKDLVKANLKGSLPGRPAELEQHMSVRVPGFDVRRADHL